MDGDLEDIGKHLKSSRLQLHDLSSPHKPGVYAFFLAEGANVGSLSHQHDQFLYLGQSSNLAKREHFKSGNTGFSTLRRSVGALLKEQLQLIAVPRATGKSKSNFLCYRFMSDGEERLSEWMTKHLWMSTHVSDEPKMLEERLIARYEPPLNLKGWSNPQRDKIKALRKRCADEARLDK